MNKHEEYKDAHGVEIKKGMRVKLAEGRSLSDDPPEYYNGVITEISDPDGDVDDEGKSFGIPPAATILFDDGEEDTFTGEIPREFYPEMAYGYIEGPIPYVFEDIEVIK